MATIYQNALAGLEQQKRKNAQAQNLPVNPQWGAPASQGGGTAAAVRQLAGGTGAPLPQAQTMGSSAAAAGGDWQKYAQARQNLQENPYEKDQNGWEINRRYAGTAAQAGIKGAVGVGGTIAGAAPMVDTGGNAFQQAIAQAESVKPKGTSAAAGQAQISTLPWTGGQAQITNPVGTPGQAQISTLPGVGQSGKGQSAALGSSSAAQGQGQNSYISFAVKDPNFQSGMSGEDQASWDAIGQKYAAGDSSWLGDTNSFREDGKWGSYTDANGNINGWLMAADGTGGYAPVFGGKVGETGYKEGTVFYAPDGTAYTMAKDGTLSKSGTVDWLKYGQYIGPKAGYQDSDFWVVENGKYKKYTTQTAPQEVLNA